MDQIELYDVLYTDFTGIRCPNVDRPGHLIPILGDSSKLVYGWALGKGPTTEVALQAWERTKRPLRGFGNSRTRTIIRHGRSSDLISHEWANQLPAVDQLRLAYVLRRVKDNAWMESFNNRFKKESRSLFLEAQSFARLEQIIDSRVTCHNIDRLHSILGYVVLRPLT